MTPEKFKELQDLQNYIDNLKNITECQPLSGATIYINSSSKTNIKLDHDISDEIVKLLHKKIEKLKKQFADS